MYDEDLHLAMRALGGKAINDLLNEIERLQQENKTLTIERDYRPRMDAYKSLQSQVKELIGAGNNLKNLLPYAGWTNDYLSAWRGLVSKIEQGEVRE